jgi:ribosomal protein S18 acetylase RimI-like enzyme
MNPISVRAAQASDLPQIIALDQAIFGWYGADEDPAVIRARLAVFPAGFIVLEEVREEAGALVGYASAEKWTTAREPALDEDPHLTHDPAGRIFCITTLAVQKSHQGRGLGKLLLDRLIAIAKNEQCTRIVLETAHAEQFYRRHGFEKIGERTQRGIRLPILALRL